jgi:molybdenum cofactor cytidylyltransferase
VAAGHFARLIATQRETGRAIVASQNGGIPQPPALFTAAWFPRLIALRGDAGARALLTEQREFLGLVPLTAAADLDTPEDYARFIAGSPD